MPGNTLREKAWTASEAILGYEVAAALKQSGASLPELANTAAVRRFVENDCDDIFARNLRAFLVELRQKGLV